MKKLGQFVGKTVRSLKAEHAVKLHQLKSAWLESVGPLVGSQTEPVKIKGKTLFLVVSSPLWAQEINLQQRLILQKLRKSLPNPPSKIVCWVGQPHTAKSNNPSSAKAGPRELVPWKNLDIPTERQEKIEKTLSTILDDRLRDKMRRLLELSVQREIHLIDKGQIPCPICGNFRDPSRTLCRACKREQSQERERRAMRILAQEPWLSGQDLADRSHIKTKPGFMKIRKTLLSNLMLQAWQATSGMDSEQIGNVMNEELRNLFLDITMLRCTLPAHSLKPQHFYAALGKRIASGYLSED